MTLGADVGNAQKFPAANIPVLATWSAPENLRSDVNRVPLLSRNRDFDFAECQVHVVQQADVVFGDFAIKSCKAKLSDVDGDPPKKRVAELILRFSLRMGSCFPEDLIDFQTKLRLPSSTP